MSKNYASKSISFPDIASLENVLRYASLAMKKKTENVPKVENLLRQLSQFFRSTVLDDGPYYVKNISSYLLLFLRI